MFNTTLPINETTAPATSRIQTAKIQARNSTEQFAGYRVGRGVKHLGSIPHLDDDTGIHDCDPIGKVFDNPEVVGDEQIGHAGFALQLGEQIENLGLDGNVKR